VPPVGFCEETIPVIVPLGTEMSLAFAAENAVLLTAPKSINRKRRDENIRKRPVH
jgi:hypothetical protein